MFPIVFKSLITLLICMSFGFICYKKRIINDEINSGLSNILVKVVLPSLIIYSMQKPLTRELAEGAVISLLVSAGLFLSGTAVGLLCCKFLKCDKTEKGVWLFALTLPNIVYMGFPVIGAALGEEALFYVSIANISFNTLAFSLGIKLITLGYGRPGSGLKSLLTNNAILALLFGSVLFVFSIALPQPVNNALSMVGNMTTPISMLIVGAMLARGGLADAVKDVKLLAVVVVRLVLIPLAALFLLKIFIHDRMILNVMVLMSAMPAASVTAIFAEKYGGNALYASKMVFISTVASVFTIPVISLLLN